MSATLEPLNRMGGTPGILGTMTIVTAYSAPATAAHSTRLPGRRGPRKNSGGTSSRGSALAMKKWSL